MKTYLQHTASQLQAPVLPCVVAGLMASALAARVDGALVGMEGCFQRLGRDCAAVQRTCAETRGEGKMLFE